MAVKISNTDVINNARKGILKSVNPGAYATGSEPSSPVEGDIIYNSTEQEPQFWDGTTWQSLYKCTGGGGGPGFTYPPTEPNTLTYEAFQPSVLTGRMTASVSGKTTAPDIAYSPLSAWGGFVHTEDGNAVGTIDGCHSYTMTGHADLNPGTINPFSCAVQDAALNTYISYGFEEISGNNGFTRTVKVAPNGSIQWEKEWGIAGQWSLPMNSVVTSGGVVINMYRYQSFSGTRLVFHRASDGAYLGARQVQGTSGKCWPCSMQLNDDGNVLYVTGVDSDRPYVMKFNAGGSGIPSVAWGRRCDDALCNNTVNTSDGSGCGSGMDSAGNVYFIVPNPSGSGDSTSVSDTATATSCILMKFNSSGSLQDSKRITLPSGATTLGTYRAQRVQCDTAGNIVVTMGTDIKKGGLQYRGLAVIKLSPTFNIIWQRIFRTSIHDQGEKTGGGYHKNGGLQVVDAFTMGDAFYMRTRKWTANIPKGAPSPRDYFRDLIPATIVSFPMDGALTAGSHSEMGPFTLESASGMAVSNLSRPMSNVSSFGGASLTTGDATGGIVKHPNCLASL